MLCRLARPSQPHRAAASGRRLPLPQRQRAAAFKIRQGSDGEAEGLAELDARCANDGSAGWSADTFRSTMQQQHAIVLVAYSNEASTSDSFLDGSHKGSLVGFVAGMFVADELQIENLAVAEAARGQSVGSMLMRSILQRHGIPTPQASSQTLGRPPQHPVCILEVKQGNAGALALYQKLGFRVVGMRKKFYADGTNAILLQLGERAD